MLKNMYVNLIFSFYLCFDNAIISHCYGAFELAF